MTLQPFDDEHFMRQALREAELAFQADEVPVGAVVVCNGRVIGRAHNLTERLNDVTAHAEMQAITAAANDLGGKYLKDCTLYVTLEPCPMCAGALHWSQMGRVVFGAFDEKAGYRRFGARMLHPKTQVVGGILEAECADLMKAFFRRKRAL
jgi:tRNA(adenine34) deaminase